MTLALALDIGGTKIAAGLVDPDGHLVHRATLPTPHGDAETVWAVVEHLLTETLAGAGAVQGIGIASAGPIDLPSGTVSPINITQWQHFPISQRVESVTGLPVRLAGDGLCMALGEHWRGAGAGAQFLLGMVVSTGVGGGLVLDGAPYDGRTGNAGHVGHVIAEPDGGALCTCGGYGCVETVASGPSMARWARAHGWDAPPEADAKDLADAAAVGNPVALSAFDRGARAIAAMIAAVGAVCDLDLVVIGGGVAKSGELLFAPIRAALGTYAGLAFLRGMRVVPAELGGDAGLVGAAALVRR